MFCTKCGKQLHDEDIFCAYCGTKVREELLQESVESSSKQEEAAFDPPFRAEAERRAKQTPEKDNHLSEIKRESVHFDWNLDGFPTHETRIRRDERFEFNWDDVIDKKRDAKSVTVEKIIPESQKLDALDIEEAENTNKPLETDEKADPFESKLKTENTEKEESLSIEDLEKELFGEEELGEADDPGFTIKYHRNDLAKGKKSQFNTYNAKRDAFQELLDRERRRVESMESQRKEQWERITSNVIQEEHEIKKPLDFEEVFIEPKTPLVPPIREVAVVLPPMPAIIIAETNPKIAAESKAVTEPKIAAEPKADAEPKVVVAPMVAAAAEPAEKVAEEEKTPPFSANSEEEGNKTKLRYSDIFPLDDLEFDDDDDDSYVAAPVTKKEIEKEDDDDDEDEEYKGRYVIKTLIVILAIIVAMELVVIGVKTFAPDSGFSRAIDNIVDKIAGVFSGGDDTDEPASAYESDAIDEYIRAFSDDAGNIGIVSHDANLKYDLDKTYAFEDIGKTRDFEDGLWDGDDEAVSKTYGQSIVSALIGYYNGWNDSNQDSNLIGINVLEIGEIRELNGEYYVLNRVTYAAEDGETVVKYETVHLRTEAEDVVVDEIKEETV